MPHHSPFRHHSLFIHYSLITHYSFTIQPIHSFFTHFSLIIIHTFTHLKLFIIQSLCYSIFIDYNIVYSNYILFGDVLYHHGPTKRLFHRLKVSIFLEIFAKLYKMVFGIFFNYNNKSLFIQYNIIFIHLHYLFTIYARFIHHPFN